MATTLFFFPPEEVRYEGTGDHHSISPLDLENKILYVGLTATGTHDMKPMPFNARYPMVGLHVNALNSMLTGQHLRESPPYMLPALALLLAIVSALIGYRSTAMTGALCLMALLGLYIFGVFRLFASTRTHSSAGRPLLLRRSHLLGHNDSSIFAGAV